MTAAPLVIGVGNEHRGDDAAGIEVARRLRGSRATEVTDCSSLLDRWEGEDAVIVVDAMRSGRPVGTVIEIDGLSQAFPIKAFPSTHSFGLAEAIELGRILGKLPERLTVYGIEASAIHPGDAMTPEVEAAVTDVAGRIESA